MRIPWDAPVELKDVCAYRDAYHPETLPAKAVFVDGKFQTIVSEEYKLIHNLEVCNAVEKALANEKFYRSNTWFNGKVFHTVYELSKYSFGVERDSSPVKPCLHVFNSYNKTMAFAVAIAAMRSICTNYLYVGNPYVIKEIHKTGSVREDKTEQIREFIDGSTVKLESTISTWDDLNALELDWQRLTDIIRSIDIPEGYKKAVKKLIKPDTGQMTAWRLINAFSYVITSPIARQRGHAAFVKGSHRKMLNPGMSKRREMMRTVQTAMNSLVE